MNKGKKEKKPPQFALFVDDFFGLKFISFLKSKSVDADSFSIS